MVTLFIDCAFSAGVYGLLVEGLVICHTIVFSCVGALLMERLVYTCNCQVMTGRLYTCCCLNCKKMLQLGLSSSIE
jgi:hypothetical protein